MRRTAVMIGALFWLSNLATLVGSAVSGTIPSSAPELASMSAHGAQMTAGTLIGQINGAAIVGYAVLLYPFLKRQHQRWALGYLAFKVVEALLLAVSAAALLALIPLGQSYPGAGATDITAINATATVTLAQQFWAARLAALAYLVATPMLVFALHRARLVPRFLTVWGFGALALLAAGLAMGVGDPSRGFQVGQVLVIPVILWELTLATWLIVRGFEAVRADEQNISVTREAAPVRSALVGPAA